MNTSSVFMNLAGLVPLSVLVWFLVIPVRGSVYRRFMWWPIAAIVIVSLGGYLGAAVGVAFDEPLQLAPIAWMEEPFLAARAIATCAVIGAGFSFGLACLVAKVLRRIGWTELPAQLVGAVGRNS